MTEKTNSISLRRLWGKEVKQNLVLMFLALVTLGTGLFVPLMNIVVKFRKWKGVPFFEQSEEYYSEKCELLGNFIENRMFLYVIVLLTLLAAVIGFRFISDYDRHAGQGDYENIPIRDRKCFWLLFTEAIVQVAVPFLVVMTGFVACFFAAGVGEERMIWEFGASYLILLLYYMNVVAFVMLVYTISGSKAYAMKNFIILFLLSFIWGVIAYLICFMDTYVEFIFSMAPVVMRCCPMIFTFAIFKNATYYNGPLIPMLDIGKERVLILLVETVIVILCARKTFVKYAKQESNPCQPIPSAKLRKALYIILFITITFLGTYAIMAAAKAFYCPDILCTSLGAVGFIVSYVLGNAALSRYFTRNQRSHKLSGRQQGILAAVCLFLIVGGHYTIGFSSSGMSTGFILFPARYTEDRVRKEELPYLDGYDWVCNQKKWKEFMEKANNGENARIRIAFSDDRTQNTRWQVEYLEITYRKGIYHARFSDHRMKPKKCKYLKEFLFPLNDQTTYDHTFYLTNDQDISYEDLIENYDNYILCYYDGISEPLSTCYESEE